MPLANNLEDSKKIFCLAAWQARLSQCLAWWMRADFRHNSGPIIPASLIKLYLNCKQPPQTTLLWGTPTLCGLTHQNAELRHPRDVPSVDISTLGRKILYARVSLKYCYITRVSKHCLPKYSSWNVTYLRCIILKNPLENTLLWVRNSCMIDNNCLHGIIKIAHSSDWGLVDSLTVQAYPSRCHLAYLGCVYFFLLTVRTHHEQNKTNTT